MLKKTIENAKAVIFDMDGTLIDSMWIWRDIDVTFMEQRGLVFPPGFQKEFEGMNYRETAEYFKKKFDFPESPEQLMDIWSDMAFERYCTKVPLKKKAGEFLQKLKKEGKKLAIATSNDRRLCEACLKALNVLELFDVILASGDVEKGKPNPEIYLTAADKLKVLPKDCVAFEDIVNGIKAAKAAGMKVVAVDDLYSEYDRENKKNTADWFIYDYGELI